MSSSTGNPQPFWHDRELRSTFIYGTAGSAIIGLTGRTFRNFIAYFTLALLGGTTAYYVAVLKNHRPIGRIGLVWTVRAGIYGALFFGLRQGIIHHRRTEERNQGIKPYQYREYDHMLSSVSAGVLASGLYSAVLFGSRSTLPSMVAGGLVSALGQWSVTAVQNWRLSYLYRNAQAVPRESGDSVEVALPKEAKSFRRYFNENVFGRGTSSDFQFPKWFPIQKLSDDEYRRLLTHRIEDIDDEVEVIDAELEELENYYKTHNPEEK
ncbi:hypothetical protein IWQ62_002940 [Dispira parvispora]|uniref:Transmembrane protein n=1 Tax=Dispira parvispora TaxID=1520584 RepID=A0A9W8APD6_9FUNG|nr:hypothetical protein IWQ62_002940 [Dispira parvispora]